MKTNARLFGGLFWGVSAFFFFHCSIIVLKLICCDVFEIEWGSAKRNQMLNTEKGIIDLSIINRLIDGAVGRFGKPSTPG